MLTHFLDLLAKDDKHNTSQLLFGDPAEVVALKRTSDGFYLLQRIQDEVHRFAITFLRQTHEKVGKNQMAFVTVRGTAFHRSL